MLSLASGLSIALAIVPTAALATDSGPTLKGSVSGAPTARHVITLRMSASELGGWQGLHLLEAALLVDGVPRDTVVFDIENGLLRMANQSLVVGTGAIAQGQFVRVNASDVVVTTGAELLEFTARLEVVNDIPSGSRFRLRAIDDAGRSTTMTRPIRSPREAGGGFGWGTVLAAIAIALLAGGLIGNLFASHRRPAQRKSIYATIQRRIDDERDTKRVRSDTRPGGAS